MKSETVSSKWRKYLFGFLILGLAGIIITVFIGYRRILKDPESMLDAIPKNADITIEKIHQSSVRDGVKEWDLDADSARYMNASKQAFLENIAATFYLKDDREIYLKADEGILQTDSKDIEVRGSVVVQNNEFRLETEKITYDHARRFLSSETPVRMTGVRIDLTANTMKADLNSQQTRFDGNVRGTFKESIRFEN